MKKPALIAASLLLLLGCRMREQQDESIPVADLEVMAEQQHPGRQLLEQYCYACHSPSASMDHMIAPPMAAVKAHYLMNEPSKAEFVKQITAYVAEPAEEASQMPGAINKFGLMPKQDFPPEAVEKIAEYLYDYKIQEPGWFRDHFNAGPGAGSYEQQGQAQIKGTGQTFKERGIQIAMAAEKHLGQQLMKQLQAHKTIDVLEYCNENALPLTQEVALKEGASIQRVSDKNRNPNNAASQEEKFLINQFRRDLAWGHEPQPVLVDDGESVRFYYPLVTNNLCLQCHGRIQDMDHEVQQKVLQLYPNDRAVGYSENQVRGLWKVSIPKQEVTK